MRITQKSAFADQSFEATLTEIVPVAIDIVRAHLIHNDAYHQLRRRLPRWLLCNSGEGADDGDHHGQR